MLSSPLCEPLPLSNSVRRYDWGSVDAIPQLLGRDPDGEPQAELWLGAHAQAPSVVQLGGEEIGLDRHIAEAPEQALGPRVAEQFGPRLPFLLKVLAAGKALSLQVHPSRTQAIEGHERELRRGIAPGDPRRSFHDDQHKPEMILALTEVNGLAGFRRPQVILDLLDGVEGALAETVRSKLLADRGAGRTRRAFQSLIAARSDPRMLSELDVAVESIRRRLAAGSPYPRADSTVLALIEQHPADPGALASLMLNRFTLDPGEAAFIPVRQVHAYLSGMGVEVMANSDNVLRAGLTTKYMDEGALLYCASFLPCDLTLPEVSYTGSGERTQNYRVPASEFALTVTVLHTGSTDAEELPADGPRIVLALDGDLQLLCDRADGRSMHLPRGASAFIPHAAGGIRLSGSGRAVCAWVP